MSSAMLNDSRGRVAEFVRVLRRKGMKVTHQRVEIFRDVVGNKAHPDAETTFKRVRKKMPTVSLDTVYRTLDLARQEGLVSVVPLASGRARYDADVSEHHHFYCVSCEAVFDLPTQPRKQIPAHPRARELGCVNSVHILAQGLCHKCLRLQKK